MARTTMVTRATSAADAVRSSITTRRVEASGGRGFVEVQIGVPNDCSIVALMTVTGRKRSEVERAASAHGYARGGGMETWAIIATAKDMGLDGEIVVSKGATPRSMHEALGDRTGFVFVCGEVRHVLPMVRGACSNFNGSGDEAVAFAWVLKA